MGGAAKWNVRRKSECEVTELNVILQIQNGTIVLLYLALMIYCEDKWDGLETLNVRLRSECVATSKIVSIQLLELTSNVWSNVRLRCECKGTGMLQVRMATKMGAIYL